MKISIGQKIRQRGNSGYSTDPNLHFHAQDSDVFARIDKNYNSVDVARGLKVEFQSKTVLKDNKPKVILNYSPVKVML